MINLEIKNIKSHPSLSLAKAKASRDLQINFNQAEDPLTITAESRHDYKCGSATQSGRSLLAESGADAPTVLSAVYTDSTPAKNRQADVPQYGRSMIEMLGVLAIIGVLSVGGIAGYSKAMQKYRINKAIEQITLIAGNVRAFFAPQRSYDGLGSCYEGDNASDASKANCKLIKKAKLMPDEMWDDTAKQFKNVFGYDVYLSTAHKSSNTDNQAFKIQYGIPKDYEICIELLSHDWTLADVKGMWLYVGATGEYVNVPINLEKAVDICSRYKDIGTSYYLMYTYFDVNSNCWNETSGNTCS